MRRWLELLSPFPTDLEPTDLIEPTGKYVSLNYWSKAMGYAASKGLTNPYKSSIFRGLVNLSKVAEEAAWPFFFVGTELRAFIDEMIEMTEGKCQ